MLTFLKIIMEMKKGLFVLVVMGLNLACHYEAARNLL
jgi:hypothetical protein